MSDLYELRFNSGLIYGAMAVFSLYLSLAFNGNLVKGRMKSIINIGLPLIFLVATTIFGILFSSQIAAEFTPLQHNFIGYYNEYNPGAPLVQITVNTQDSSYFVLLVSAIVSFWSSLLFLKGRSAFLASMPFILVMLSGLLTSVFPNIIYLAVNFSVFTLIRILDIKENRIKRISALIGTIICIVTIIILNFTLLSPTTEFAKAHQEDLQAIHQGIFGDTSKSISDILNENILKTSPLKNEPIEFNGTTELNVTLSNYPEDIIYLKGFSGGEYNSDSWSINDDNNNLLDLLHSNGYESDSLNSIWETGFYYFSPIKESSDINIHENRSQNLSYTPYNILVGDMEVYGDSYIKKKENSYSYESYPTSYNYEIQNTVGLTAAYMEYVRTHYLNVPDMPSVAELVAPAQGLSTQEKIDFVVSYLINNYEYSMDISPISDNVDYVENFLFTQRKGFCQHFASAAVLMLRNLGIPTRYAAGYAVSPGDFTEISQGYQAYIPDEYAHSWAEVYIDGTGWMPVEATPNLAPPLANAEYNQSILPESNIATPSPSPTPIPTPTPTPDANTAQTNPTPTPNSTPVPTANQNNQSSMLLKALMPFIFIILAVALIIFGIIFRIRFIRKKYLNVNNKKSQLSLTKRILEMMEFVFARTENMTDKEYILSLSLKLELIELAELIDRLSFDNDFEIEDQKVLSHYYNEMRTQLINQLSPWKKFLFIVVYCF